MKSILITGAAGAIGQAVAQQLYGSDVQMILMDRDEKTLQKVADRFPQSHPFVADVSNAHDMARAYDLISYPLDSVVLAAGIEGPVADLENCPDDDFAQVMNINVHGVWLGLKHALKVMKAQKSGSIVALASITALRGSKQMAPYAASKHAVLGLIRTAAREAAPFGVRCNAVCPGPVESAMMNRIDAAFDRLPVERMIPAQRYASAQDVANLIAFLSSQDSRYINGAALNVDGAFTA